MNLRSFFALALACLWSAACDRPIAESERLARERAELEREKAQLAADQAAAERAVLAGDRARLEAERAALSEDKAKIAARTNTERDLRLANERAQREAAEARARQAEAAAQNAAAEARAEQSIEFFYEALDPHGDWLRVEPHGYCWQPRQARDPGWRPYTDGGWVYTDYGWTWRSNEPFGWAVYHYGRWARLPGRGWIWVPNTEWGPAWVSWRRSDDYVGWAPLPPDAWSTTGFSAAVDSYYDIGPGLYNFVRVTDLGEPTYVGRVVAPEQNVTIVNQTVNVTNVTYKTVKNKVTIVNQGPDLTVINQRSRTPVRRLAIERQTGSAGGERAAKVEGSILRVVAPELRAKSAGTKPRAVKEEVQNAEVDRGWKEAKEDAPKIRAAARQRAQEAEAAERAGPTARMEQHSAENAKAPAQPRRSEERPNQPQKRELRQREKAQQEQPTDPAATKSQPAPVEEGAPSPRAPSRPDAPPQPRPAPPEKPAAVPETTPVPAKPPLEPFRDPAPPSTDPASPAPPVDDDGAATRKKREKREQRAQPAQASGKPEA